MSLFDLSLLNMIYNFKSKSLSEGSYSDKIMLESVSTRKRHLFSGHCNVKFEFRHRRFDCSALRQSREPRISKCKERQSIRKHIFQDVCLSPFQSPKNLRYAKCQGNIKQRFASQRFHVKNYSCEKMALRVCTTTFTGIKVRPKLEHSSFDHSFKLTLDSILSELISRIDALNV